MYQFLLDQIKSSQKRSKQDQNELIHKSLNDLVKLYDINFDGENIISFDSNMINHVYYAAFDLLECTGIYCLDDKSVLEVDLSILEKKIKLYSIDKMITGAETEQTTILSRSILDGKKPSIMGGPTGAPVTVDLFQPIHRSYIQCRCIDSLGPATIVGYNTTEKSIPAINQMEEAHHTISQLKECCRLEGRLGLSCVSPPFIESVSASISIANNSSSKKDLQEIYPQLDLTYSIDELIKVAHYKLSGLNYLCSTRILLGGFTTTSPEQFAILQVAEYLKSCYLYGGVFFKMPSLIGQTTTSKENLWASSIASMAIARNTNSVFGTVLRNSSGPSTKMSFYETALQAICLTISGDSILSGPISNNGFVVNHSAGLESKFMADIADFSRMLTISEANYLCLVLYEKIQRKLSKPDYGLDFSNCYDLKTLLPKQDYYLKYTNILSEILSVHLENK